MASTLLVVLLLGSLALRFKLIAASLPYCRHVDEATWSAIAIRMVQTGDLNPHRFTKPSIQAYTMATGFSLGLVRSGAERAPATPQSLGKLAYPYYELPRAAEVPKRVYALLSVGALALMGLIAFRLWRDQRLLWLAPLVACLSTAYLECSWTYMNVDILGCFFACATLAFLIVEHKNDEAGARDVSRAALSGVLSGLTLGCKYNLVWIAVPCLLYAVLFTRERLISRLVAYGICLSITFLLTTPYGLLDYSHFITQMAREARHYADGHRGATVEAGWPACFAYFSHFRENFGVIGLLLAVLGGGVMWVRDCKWTLIVISYPVLLVWYMSQQRASIVRNVVVVQLFLALCIAFGLLWSIDQVLARLARLAWFRARPHMAYGATALFVAACASGLPWSAIASAHSLKVESRNRAQNWILHKVPAGTPVLIDERLKMDARTLERAGYPVSVFAPRVAAIEAARLRAEHPGAIAIVNGRSDAISDELSSHRDELLTHYGTFDVAPKVRVRIVDPTLLIFRFPEVRELPSRAATRSASVLTER